MANLRGFIDYTDISGREKTFKIDGVTIVYDSTKVNGADATMIGKAVSLSADDTVQLCSDAEAVIGRLERVEANDGDSAKALVYCKGPLSFPGGAAATLTRGTKIVGAVGAAAAKGYIRSAAAGVAAELLIARGHIIRNGTTTAVIVDLD